MCVCVKVFLLFLCSCFFFFCRFVIFACLPLLTLIPSFSLFRFLLSDYFFGLLLVLVLHSYTLASQHKHTHKQLHKHWELYRKDAHTHTHTQLHKHWHIRNWSCYHLLVCSTFSFFFYKFSVFMAFFVFFLLFCLFLLLFLVLLFFEQSSFVKFVLSKKKCLKDVRFKVGKYFGNVFEKIFIKI